MKKLTYKVWSRPWKNKCKMRGVKFAPRHDRRLQSQHIDWLCRNWPEEGIIAHSFYSVYMDAMEELVQDMVVFGRPYPSIFDRDDIKPWPPTMITIPKFEDLDDELD